MNETAFGYLKVDWYSLPSLACQPVNVRLEKRDSHLIRGSATA